MRGNGTWALVTAILLSGWSVGCGDDSETADSNGGGAAAGSGAGGDEAGGSGGATAAGSGGTVPAVATDACAPITEVFDTSYEVGPGQALAEPGEVPWESLGDSTLVQIHYRAEPYASKWVLNTEATADRPLVVRGVPDDAGQLPVITGDGATTRGELSYWNEDRSVVKVGGSNLPSDTVVPAHIRIECLDIRSGRPAYAFTDADGATGSYADNAAAIHVEVGSHITIRGCSLSDSGNGLFAGHGASDLLVDGNHIHDNGIADSIYHHNNYTEALGITFQYNHFGPLREGCPGNNLKDRSAGTVIRYNFIEAGNRQLDLVESDYTELTGDPSYDETFVYGNVLVEPEGAGNSQIVHYGGDGGDESMYRGGTLHFYNNTVVSTRDGNTTLLRMSTNTVSADVFNNAVFTTAASGSLAICSGTGQIDLHGNYLPTGWRDTHEATLEGQITAGDNLEGVDPGFANLTADDYSLISGAACLGAAQPLGPAVLPAHDVTMQYVVHQGGEARPDTDALSIGAMGPATP